VRLRLGHDRRNRTFQRRSRKRIARCSRHLLRLQVALRLLRLLSIRRRLFTPPRNVNWSGNRFPLIFNSISRLAANTWAMYVDPLSAPTRAHLVADVRRTAAFYGAPLLAPRPPRPNSIPALCTAALLDIEDHEVFRNAVFDALWQEQRDIQSRGTREVSGLSGKRIEDTHSSAFARCTQRLGRTDYPCARQRYLRGPELRLER
jgi:hypothetical protein